MRRGVPAVLISLFLAGCSSTEGPIEVSPWQDEFDRVYATATTDFVRAVVADGQLSLAEMREASQRTMECWASVDAPFVIREADGGVFHYLFETPDVYDVEEHLALAEAASTPEARECTLGYWNDLWMLWDLIRVNPERADFDDLVVGCLVRHDLADERLTAREFREAAAACEFWHRVDPADLHDEHLMRDLAEQYSDCRPRLANGLYLDTCRAWDCRMDPLGA